MQRLAAKWAHRKALVSLVLIFLVAFVVRAGYAIVGPQELTFDEPYYDHIANQIVSGNGFTFEFSAWFTSVPNQPTSVQEPLYPLFLAATKILFGSGGHLAARIAQSIIGAGIAALACALGCRVFHGQVGILAGSIMALYPPLLYFGRFLMTETLFTFFLVMAISLVHKKASSSKWCQLAAGLGYGLACLTRSVAVGFAPVVLLWTWLTDRSKRSGFVAAVLAASGMVLVVTPWALRNYLVHDAFVPFVTKGGWNLYFYNYPVPNYDFNHRWVDVPIPDLGGLTEIERES